MKLRQNIIAKYISLCLYVVDSLSIENVYIQRDKSVCIRKGTHNNIDIESAFNELKLQKNNCRGRFMLKKITISGVFLR